MSVAYAHPQADIHTAGATSESDTFIVMTSSLSKLSRSRNLSVALAVIGLVITGEYFFRHYGLFWLPIFGTLLVNDMLALFLVYSVLTVGLGVLLRVNWSQELAGVGQALRVGLTSWNFTIWLLTLVLSVVALPVADRLLWGKVALPMFLSSHQNPAVWWTSLASPLKAVSLIFVNGFFVPIAEEYLWRGLVQARLMDVFSTPFAVGLTAILFSFKHALVDASMGRFLTLIAFGVICGIVAHRKDWWRSAALHIFVNTAFTVMGLILGLE